MVTEICLSRRRSRRAGEDVDAEDSGMLTMETHPRAGHSRLKGRTQVPLRRLRQRGGDDMGHTRPETENLEIWNSDFGGHAG